jgi:ubiquinone/menaquinone biosynthesis C-methylase UbiE
VAQALNAFLDSETDIDVLDCGCGTGHWLTTLASPGRRVVGLDRSAEMLMQAARRKPLELVRGEAEYLPFETGSFDRVFCVNSFHHFPSKQLFVSEVRRVLKPRGGFATIGLDPHTGLDRWWIYDYFKNALELDKQRYPSQQSTAGMMTAAGLEDCRTEIAQYLPAARGARRTLDRGDALKASTSQLAILTDDEFQRGVQRIQEDILTAARRGQDLLLLSDLRLYATTGWRR